MNQIVIKCSLCCPPRDFWLQPPSSLILSHLAGADGSCMSPPKKKPGGHQVEQGCYRANRGMIISILVIPSESIFPTNCLNLNGNNTIPCCYAFIFQHETRLHSATKHLTSLCMCWDSLAVRYVGVSKSSMGLPLSFSYFSLYFTCQEGDKYYFQCIARYRLEMYRGGPGTWKGIRSLPQAALKKQSCQSWKPHVTVSDLLGAPTQSAAPHRGGLRSTEMLLPDVKGQGQFLCSNGKTVAVHFFTCQGPILQP